MRSHKVRIDRDPSAEVWYNDLDECHREDGTAWIGNTGWYWYYRSKLHRTNGPARLIKSTNELDWIVNGRVITYNVEQWLKETGYNWPLNKEQETEFKLRFL